LHSVCVCSFVRSFAFCRATTRAVLRVGLIEGTEGVYTQRRWVCPGTSDERSSGVQFHDLTHDLRPRAPPPSSSHTTTYYPHAYLVTAPRRTPFRPGTSKMEVELHVSSSSSIAVRNEEFNRQRLKNVAPGTVRITDPAKFAALQVRSSRQSRRQSRSQNP
jgi:hypothetical protein